MGTTAADYLRELGSGRRPDLPETTTGTVRLDVREDGRTEHWRLDIADQHVEVTRSGEDADLVVHGDRDAFDRVAAGEMHVSAALLRNELTASGDIRLFMMLRRLFPGPANARHPREAARAVAERGGRP